jgi:hypothetical protein
MVGIFKKFKNIMKFTQQYAPLLNNVAPGLGDTTNFVLKGIDAGGDFVDGFARNFKKNKKNCFIEGIKGGLDGIADWNSSDLNQLSNKIKLKASEESE